jgi:hypothetical protein
MLSKKVVEQLKLKIARYDDSQILKKKNMKYHLPFHKYYLKKPVHFDRDHYDWFYFSTMLKDGFDMETAVRLKYKSKLEKIRLNNKMKELNINPWEISSRECFPRTNKHGNFKSVWYKGDEILF